MNDGEQEENRRDGEDESGGDGRRSIGKRRRRSGGEEDGTRSNISDTTRENSEERSAIKRNRAGVSSGLCGIAEHSRRSTSRTRELPTWLGKSREDMELQYWKNFKERCVRIHHALQKSDGWLVRDIVYFNDFEEVEGLLKCIQGNEHYRRGLLTVCRESDHLHIAHDCVWSNKSCRCSWWQKAQTLGTNVRRNRNTRRRHSCRSRRLSDVESLLLYYCTEERRLVYQKIQGHVERLPCEDYNISSERLEELLKRTGQMELQAPGIRSELQFWDEDLGEDVPDESTPRRVHNLKSRHKVGKKERISLRVIEVLKENPCCPPEAIVKTKLWRLHEELRFKGLGDPEIKSAIQSYKDELTTFSIEDFKAMYDNEKCVPIFSAGNRDFNTKYYNIENSVSIMMELISYQCSDDDEGIYDFVKTLFDVLEMKQPKMNTIVIYSDPSAGKNFFFDAVCDFYINVGSLANANRYNSFPFQNADSRRIIIYNEPSYEEARLEDLKMLMGGDKTEVNVKYQSHNPVFRTPIIVLTNEQKSFMTHSAFKDRIRIFRWRPAPFLAKYLKKPNPLAIYHIFKRFNLV